MEGACIKPLMHKLIWIMLVSSSGGHLVEVPIGVFVETANYPDFKLFNSSMAYEARKRPEANVTYKLTSYITDSGYDTYKLASTICNGNSTLYVSFMPCHTNPSLGHVIRHVHKPVISWRVCDTYQPHDWPFGMTSLGVSFHAVTLEVIRKEKWSRLVFIYDDHADSRTAHRMVHDLGEEHDVTIVQLDHKSAFENTDVDIWFQHVNYLLYCSKWNVINVLKKARLNKLDLLGPRYRWLLLDTGDLNGKNMTSLLQEGDNVAVIRPYQMSIRRTTNFGPENKSSITYSLWTYAHLRRGGMGMRHVGNWSSVTGLNLWQSLYPQMMEGFNNRTFLITTLQYEPFTIKHQNGTWSGLLIDFLEELQFALNFSYIIQESSSMVFGRDMGNGTFNGIVGEVQRKDVDFALAPISIQASRGRVVDFTTPFWDDPYIVLIRRPDPGESMIFICLGPFSDMVWFVIMLSVLVVSVVLWVSLKYYPGPKHQSKLTGLELLKLTTWQTFGALMQQGMVKEPVITSGRLIVAMWWFYVIIIAGVYNGNLIAFLTAPKAELPINSLQDLADSDMKFGTLRDAALHGTLISARSGVYKQLWDKAKDDVEDLFYWDSNEGLARVLENKNYAYLIEASYYTMLHIKNGTLKEHQCGFARPNDYFLSNMYGFAFQKGSPYTSIFSMQMLRILESGLLERIKHKWMTGGNRCTGLERVSSQTNIGLMEAQGAFYILSIGIVAAIVVLLFECLSMSTCKETMFKDLMCFRSTLTIGSSIPNATSKQDNSSVRLESVSTDRIATIESIACQMEDPGSKSNYDVSAFEALTYVDIVTGKVTQSNAVFDPNNEPNGVPTANGMNGVVLNQNGAVASSESTKKAYIRQRSKGAMSIKIKRGKTLKTEESIDERDMQTSTL